MLNIVVKSKQTDVETCNLINRMATGCNLELATLYEQHKMETDLRYIQVHIRYASKRMQLICKIARRVSCTFMVCLWICVASVEYCIAALFAKRATFSREKRQGLRRFWIAALYKMEHFQE